MCGVGVLLNGQDHASAAGAMVRALRHRGPDGEAVRSVGPATLIHTRLAIIDPVGGDQPLASEDGTCTVVANGEIYNHLALRHELEASGHMFATGSDCEVIVHGYEEWGRDVLRRLNGILALALWDAPRQRLLLARDAFGVKPLYWAQHGDRLLAASEIKALLAAGCRAELDPIALDHLLAWRFVPGTRTLFAGIHKLPPAGILEADGDGVRLSSFRERPGAMLTDASSDELARELGDALEAAVARQMMSDVPYGAFLSGGLDSAAVAAAMRRNADSPPLTYTIGFPGAGPAVDERGAAAATARAIGTRHADTAMTATSFLAELATSVRAVEEPCGSPSALAAMQLSRFAADDVKVVLSGQGADEPLGGYQRHLAAALFGALDRCPGALRAPVVAAAHALPRNERAKRAAALLETRPGLDRLLGIFEITDARARDALIGREHGAEALAERREIAESVLCDIPERPLLDQALYLDTRVFLPDQLLLWGDKASMAASLEQRVPFLDAELMRLVDRIPAAVRMRRGRKWLYRRAVRTRVPAAVLRRRKRPFATPYDEWLRAELGEEVRSRYAAGTAVSERVRPATVDRLVREHRSGRADHKRILYCLLELSEWHGCFVEQASRLSLSRSAA